MYTMRNAMKAYITLIFLTLQVTHKLMRMKRFLLIIITFLATSIALPVSTWAESDTQAIEQGSKEVEIALRGNVLRIVGANGMDVKIYNLAGYA